MKKYNILIALLVISFVSCKEKEQIKEVEKIEEKPFTVEIQMKVNEDDVICLYYKDNTITFFNEDMAIYKNLVKGDSLQNIVFELPKGFVPNDFRFDLSHQNKNNTIFVEKINFTFKDKDFQIKNEDIDKYLKPNEGVVFDSTNRSFSFKELDGNYDPFLATTEQFFPLLEGLVGYEAFVNKVQ